MRSTSESVPSGEVAPPPRHEPEGRGPRRAVTSPWWELSLLLALLCLGGLWRFEGKGILYFDELINAGLANDGVILEYSLRPLYRLLNRAAWLVFGQDSESLLVFGFLSYAATALLVYRTARLLSGRLIAWSAFLAVAFSETVLIHGVRGMPHMPAGLFLTLSLYHLLGSQRLTTVSEASAHWHGGAAGVLALAAVAVHPTLLPFAMALGLWAVATLVVRGVRTKSWRSISREPSFALVIALGISVLVLTGITALDERSYFGAILGGVETVQQEAKYDFYHRPWHQYLGTLADDTVLLVVLVVSLLGAVVARGTARRTRLSVPTVRRGVALVWLSCFSIGLLSLLSWRFERVFVSYVPLLALTGAALAASAHERLGVRPARALGIGLLSVSTLGGVVSLAATDEALDRIETEDWKQFDRFSEVLSSVIESDQVGYLGDGGRYERARNFVHGSGKHLVYLDAELSRTTKALETELTERELFFVLTDFSDPSDPRAVASWWNDGLSILRFDEVYEHRDFFRLWRVRPRAGEPEMHRALSGIEPGTRIAVLGWRDELDPTTDFWIRSLLEQYGLRDYRLSLHKNARVQFNYVPAKDIRYVWLIPSTQRLEESNYDAFRRLVIEAGARLLGADHVAPAELWEVPR